MTVYAYDPYTGAAIDLDRALVVVEPAPTRVDNSIFADLGAEDYAELDAAGRQHFIAAALQHVPTRIWLNDADSEEHLDADELEAVFCGDDQTVRNRVEDAFAERRRRNLEEELTAVLEGLGADLAPEELEQTHRDRLTEAIEAADASDVYAQLLHNTPRCFLRYQIGRPETATSEAATQRKVIEAAVRSVGLDPQNTANAAAIDSLVAETREHWHEYYTVDVIVHARPERLVPGPYRRTVHVEDPWILVFDPVNGTGHDELFTGTASLVLEDAEHVREDGEKRRFFPDTAGSIDVDGYSWETTADPEPTAYTFTPSPEPVEPVAAAAHAALVHARKNWRAGLLIEDPVEALFPQGVPQHG